MWCVACQISFYEYFLLWFHFSLTLISVTTAQMRGASRGQGNPNQRVDQHRVGPTLGGTNTGWDQHRVGLTPGGSNTGWDQHRVGLTERRPHSSLEDFV